MWVWEIQRPHHMLLCDSSLDPEVEAECGRPKLQTPSPRAHLGISRSFHGVSAMREAVR